MARFLAAAFLIVAPSLCLCRAQAPAGFPEALAVQAVPQPVKHNYFLELYIAHILVLMAALTAASEAAEHSYTQSVPRIRASWNWLLLISFAACAGLGFALLFPLAKSLKSPVINLHCQAGAVAAWAAGYHCLKHFRRLLYSA
jgi:hypothetical protein